jgi:hypothetical protein
MIPGRKKHASKRETLENLFTLGASSLSASQRPKVPLPSNFKIFSPALLKAAQQALDIGSRTSLGKNSKAPITWWANFFTKCHRHQSMDHGGGMKKERKEKRGYHNRKRMDRRRHRRKPEDL